MRFNTYLNSHFSGCRILAHTYDVSRGRPVTVHLIPGQVELVGISDGVDAFVAPVIANPYDCKVAEILKDLFAGKNPATYVDPKLKQFSQVEPASPSPPSRRRLQKPAPVSQTPVVSRRRLNAQHSPA